MAATSSVKYVKGSDPAAIVTDILARKQRAKTMRDHWMPLYQECFDFAMPYRQSFFEEAPGTKRNRNIFDDTAVVGVQEFASRLQEGIAPQNARFAQLVAGTDVPDDQKKDVNEALDLVTEAVFEVLRGTNFTSECHEALLDVAAGTAAMFIEDWNSIVPVRFNTIPLSALLIDTGPDDQIDTIIRERKLRYEHIQAAYPTAQIPQEYLLNRPKEVSTSDKGEPVIDCTYRDWSRPTEEIWKRSVILCETHIILEEIYEGIGSCPWVVARWSKASGEVWGRGPLFNAMPSIRTTNLVVELILEHGEMAIAGIYTIEDDGSINTDTIKLVPGTMIPVAPNSQGLKAVGSAGQFNVADIILADQRQNIKKALYNDSLGNPEGTPMSATEVAERMADLARRIGAPFDRLWNEFIAPVIRRVVYILKRRGLIELPAVNGRTVKLNPTSPLAQAQNQQDILNVDRWLDFLMRRFGPQLVNVYAKGDDVALFIAQKLGVPEKLVRSKIEQKAFMQQIQQLAATAQQQPEGSNAPS